MFSPIKNFNDKRIKSIVDKNEGKDSGDYIEFEEISSKTPELLPEKLSDTIIDASRLSDNKIAESNQTLEVFNQLFADMNKKYNLDIQIDFQSFTTTLKSIIDPRNRRTLEIYLSEAYGRFRVVLYTRLMAAITLLSEDILDPTKLLSSELSYADKFHLIDRLFNYMTQINDITEKLDIQSAELELEKLGDRSSDINSNDPKVDEFLTALSRSILDK